ncbi:Hypothetical predicted protein [Podarcis lilfordi]|uniref:Uncharacterized protein n=1 Tax=Podarcis lilfordi TaxID=74358 RepID=A0AA35JYC6_9SAUR|nr:Hypothetical predicted protein [Podarcis lilfordi]
MSRGKERTNVPQREAEEAAEAKAKLPAVKLKASEASTGPKTETAKEARSDAIARAAEKVARSQIALVLQSAKAELRHRRRNPSLRQKDTLLNNLEENGINETEMQ